LIERLESQFLSMDEPIPRGKLADTWEMLNTRFIEISASNLRLHDRDLIRCKERKGKERKGKEREEERKGKERKGKERKGKERKGKERKGKSSQTKWKTTAATQGGWQRAKEEGAGSLCSGHGYRRIVQRSTACLLSTHRDRKQLEQ
jgi:hypothetical protein